MSVAVRAVAEQDADAWAGLYLDDLFTTRWVTYDMAPRQP